MASLSPLRDRDSQQIDPEKMLRKRDQDSPAEDQLPACPSTQPLPRRGFLAVPIEEDECPSPDPELMREPSSEGRFDEAGYLSRSYGSNSHFQQHLSRPELKGRVDISPRRDPKKAKKKRVMSTTTSFSPSTLPSSPLESPMITSITKGARYVPSTPESGEEYVLRRDQQIDPEKQLLRRDHPDPDEEHPEAPSTGPLPRRNMSATGALKPKALFLEDDEVDETELTFERSSLATRSQPSITVDERERRLLDMERKLAKELEDLSLLRKSLMEKEKELSVKEQRLDSILSDARKLSGSG